MLGLETIQMIMFLKSFQTKPTNREWVLRGLPPPDDYYSLRLAACNFYLSVPTWLGELTHYIVC